MEEDNHKFFTLGIEELGNKELLVKDETVVDNNFDMENKNIFKEISFMELSIE